MNEPGNGTDYCLESGGCDFNADIYDMLRQDDILTITVLLGSLSCVGTLGNLCVLVVFSLRFQKRTSTYFILSLAGIDLVICLFVIPGLIIKTWYYQFYFDWLCKLWEMFRMYSLPTSALLLVAIAFDRYFLICMATNTLMTKFRAKLVIFTIAVVGLGLSIPPLLAVGVYEIDDDGSEVYRGICIENYWLISIKGLHNYWIFVTVLFCGMILVITVLYSCVFVTVYKQDRRWRPSRQRSKVHPHPQHKGDNSSQDPKTSDFKTIRQQKAQDSPTLVYDFKDQTKTESSISDSAEATQVKNSTQTTWEQKYQYPKTSLPNIAEAVEMKDHFVFKMPPLKTKQPCADSPLSTHVNPHLIGPPNYQDEEVPGVNSPRVPSHQSPIKPSTSSEQGDDLRSLIKGPTCSDRRETTCSVLQTLSEGENQLSFINNCRSPSGLTPSHLCLENPTDIDLPSLNVPLPTSPSTFTTCSTAITQGKGSNLEQDSNHCCSPSNGDHQSASPSPGQIRDTSFTPTKLEPAGTSSTRCNFHPNSSYLSKDSNRNYDLCLNNGNKNSAQEEIHRQTSTEESTCVSITTTAQAVTTPHVHDADKRHDKATGSSSQRNNHVKMARVVFMVTVVYIVSFLPTFLVSYQVIENEAVFYVYFINNAANPVIYSFMNKKFRAEVKALVKGFLSKLTNCCSFSDQK